MNYCKLWENKCFTFVLIQFIRQKGQHNILIWYQIKIKSKSCLKKKSWNFYLCLNKMENSDKLIVWCVVMVFPFLGL